MAILAEICHLIFFLFSRNLHKVDSETSTASVPYLEQAPDLNEYDTDFDDVISEDDCMELVDLSSDEDQEEEDDVDIPPSLYRLETDDDQPLYVIPSSQSLYRCPVPQFEHLLAASALVSKYNMSATMIKDVLAFTQLGMPENNLCASSLNDLQQFCGFDADYLKYHLYCERCTKLFDMESEIGNCKTSGCDGSKTDSQKYFVTGKLEMQFREILERDNMWESIDELKQGSPDRVSVSDICTGLGYRKLQEPGGFLDGTQNLTLSLFIDGIPLYKSSSVSLWPVYLLINEIPPQQRFRKKNMVLWGVWQGVGKPNMNMFLRPLVMDLIELFTNGVTISITSENQVNEINVKAMLVVATMDLQARAYVTNMTQHNGDHGCLYCMESGQIVPSGKAYCRAYIQRDETPILRTDEMARASAVQARQTGKRIDGFFGESVLLYLPYFSIVNNIVIDYMHGTLLGVTKKFLDYWFQSTYSKESFYIGKSIGEIDKILKRIQPPYIIHRLPRILSNNYHHWKASELRNWLLFYSLPCLLDLLPSVYLTHFSCLVEATYILLSEGLSFQDLERADVLLRKFVSNVQKLYGDNAMSLNVHNLTHLTHFVKQWGPLWGWSCFAFESFNGEIKRSVHGTGIVCKQIFWALQAQKRVEMLSSQATSNHVQDFLQTMQDHRSKKFLPGSEAFQCSVVRSLKTQVNLHREVKEHLKALGITNSDSDYVNITKIARNGYQMYSKCCTRGKKQNSYTVKLQKPLEGNLDIIEVSRYIMEKNSRRVFAIGQLMKTAGPILPRRAAHLQKIESVG